MRFIRALIIAIFAFLALFGSRLAYDFRPQPPSDGQFIVGQQYSSGWTDFELSRKNYASGKMKEIASAPAAQSLGNAERYEKVASLGQITRAFDDDTTKLMALIASHRGTVQYESAQGLNGRRRLDLGIGVPPNEFDGFIAAAKQVGRLTHLSIVKNDKTNEYMALRAQKTSLEKAMSAIEALRKLDASVDERLKLEQRYNDLEEQVQRLGVSLGEFDTQNELYTVKLSVQEVGAPVATSRASKVFRAFAWSAEYYCYLSFGLLCFAGFLWIGFAVLMGAIRLSKKMQEV